MSVKILTEVYSDYKKVKSSNYVYITSDYLAKIDDEIAVDTTSNTLTITLPSGIINSAAKIELYDVGGNLETNNVTINSNSKIIMGDTQDLLIDVNNTRLLFIYVNDTIGWRIMK
jgi:hypothetical protein